MATIYELDEKAERPDEYREIIKTPFNDPDELRIVLQAASALLQHVELRLHKQDDYNLVREYLRIENSISDNRLKDYIDESLKAAPPTV